MKKELILAISMAMAASTGFAADNNSATGSDIGGSTGSAGASSSGSSGSSGGSYGGTTGSATGSTSGAMSTDGTGATMGATASVDMKKFDKLDKNKDGMLSKAEIKKDRKLNKQFDSADTDKDGNVSQAEYQAIAATTAGAGTSGAAQPDSSKDYNLGGSDPANTKPGNYGDQHTPQGSPGAGSSSSSSGSTHMDGSASGSATMGSGATGSASDAPAASGGGNRPDSAKDENLGGSDPAKDQAGNFGDQHTTDSKK